MLALLFCRKLMTLKLYWQMVLCWSLIHFWQSQLQKGAWVHLGNFARSVSKTEVPACWQRCQGSNLQVVGSSREPEVLKSSTGTASVCKTSACGYVQPQVASVVLLGSDWYISNLTKTCSPFICIVIKLLVATVTVTLNNSDNNYSD